jgi:hypothetical protein
MIGIGIEVEDESDVVHSPRNLMTMVLPDHQSSNSMIDTGIEVKGVPGVVLSPRALLTKSFDFESVSSWSIGEGDILQSPRKKGKEEKEGKPVAEGGIVRTEGNSLDVIFERVEASACNEKLPDGRHPAMVLDPQSSNSMIGFEVEDETDVVDSPQNLYPNSFDSESGLTWSIAEGEIVRSPGQKRKGRKPVAEGGIMTAEGDVLYAVFESIEAFACNEKIPDRPPKGMPLAIELYNSVLDDDYALKPTAKVSCTGAGANTCKASKRTFLKKKPDGDRNAASRLGEAIAIEVEPYVAPLKEENIEEHPESSCTTCIVGNKSFLKKKPDDGRNAASRLGEAIASEVEPYVASLEEEKKDKHPESSCTGVGATTCSSNNKSFLKKKPDDDRNAASRLGGGIASEVEPYVALLKEEMKEEHPESSCTGVGATRCSSSNKSFLKKKTADDRNAASRLGEAIKIEVEPSVAPHEKEKKEEHPESSCTGVGAKTYSTSNKSFLKKKPDGDRNAASRLREAIASEVEPYVAPHEEEKKDKHLEPDPQERTQAVVVKPTEQKFGVLDFVFQHVEGFLRRDTQPTEVEPDLKQSWPDNSSPIKLHPITPKPEQKEVMLDFACYGFKGSVWRGTGDDNAESQQDDLEVGSPMPEIKVGADMLREHSLLDLIMSSDSDDQSISRLEELRKKKRNIEIRIRSSSTEPGILVPEGYAGKSATPKTKPRKERKEQRKNKKFMGTIVIAVIAVSAVAALVVVGMSFFMSPTV